MENEYKAPQGKQLVTGEKLDPDFIKEVDMEKEKESLAELTERALAAQNVTTPIKELSKTYLESLTGEQLDVLTFFVYGFVEFDDRSETINKLVGRHVSPDRLELMERMLEIVKKI